MWTCSLERDHAGVHKAYRYHSLRADVLAEWSTPCTDAVLSELERLRSAIESKRPNMPADQLIEYVDGWLTARIALALHEKEST